MPKARPVSLHPLSFDDAIKALMAVNPDPAKLGSKRSKPERQRKPKPTGNKK